MMAEGFATAILLRYNFTYNFLVGAATMIRLAKEIDAKGKTATETEQPLESDVWSLLFHGPGHHLGSDGLDKQSKEILSIVGEQSGH